MKKLIFSFLLMAIASVCVFSSCSKDDDDAGFGTSYWNSNDLKGHWVGVDNATIYIDFTVDGTFTGKLGRGSEYNYGKYKVSNSTIPENIAVQFPKSKIDPDIWWSWYIEWLTPDKKKMRFDTLVLKKE